MFMGLYVVVVDDVNFIYLDEYDIYEEDMIIDDNWYEDFVEEELELMVE